MIPCMGNAQHILPMEESGNSQPCMTITPNRNMISENFKHNTCSVVKILPFGAYLLLCLPDFIPIRLPYWQ